MPEGCRGCCMTIIMIPLLACALIVFVAIYMSSNSPEPPLGENYRSSHNDAQAFNNEIQRAVNSAMQQNWFYFQFNQYQLSSWLDLEGSTYATEHDFPFPFDDLQVKIDGGQFTFYADAEYSSIRAPLEIIIEPKVDNRGHIDFAIESASMGGIPLPPVVLTSITDPIETKLFEYIKAQGDYELYPETLSANGGTFAVQGVVRP